MSESFDEVTTDVTRAIRMTVMIGSQAAERLARVRADREREAADASRERAAQLREQLGMARDAARGAYEPVADPRRFPHADAETAVAAWSTATAWAQSDPRAAAAAASLSQQIRQRWGVDPKEVREHVANQRATKSEAAGDAEPAETDRDRYERDRDAIREMRSASPDYVQQHLARIDRSFDQTGKAGMDHDHIREAATSFAVAGRVPSSFLDHVWSLERDPNTARPPWEAESEPTTATEGVRTSTDERFTAAMDPQWRDQASTEDLEKGWHEANADLTQPGATEVCAALEATLAERMGVDLEAFRRESEPKLDETLFHAAGDLAASDADRAAEAGARMEEAAWENRASEERGREAAADTANDPGLEAEESSDVQEAEGKGTQAHGEAEVEHAQGDKNESRADAEGMRDAGVPGRSQQVRTSTARGFGSTPTAGANAKHHPKARKNTRGADRTSQRDMGR